MNDKEFQHENQQHHETPVLFTEPQKDACANILNELRRQINRFAQGTQFESLTRTDAEDCIRNMTHAVHNLEAVLPFHVDKDANSRLDDIERAVREIAAGMQAMKNRASTISAEDIDARIRQFENLFTVWYRCIGFQTAKIATYSIGLTAIIDPDVTTNLDVRLPAGMDHRTATVIRTNTENIVPPELCRTGDQFTQAIPYDEKYRSLYQDLIDTTFPNHGPIEFILVERRRHTTDKPWNLMSIKVHITYADIETWYNNLWTKKYET